MAWHLNLSCTSYLDRPPLQVRHDSDRIRRRYDIISLLEALIIVCGLACSCSWLRSESCCLEPVRLFSRDVKRIARLLIPALFDEPLSKYDWIFSDRYFCWDAMSGRHAHMMATFSPAQVNIMNVIRREGWRFLNHVATRVKALFSTASHLWSLP